MKKILLFLIIVNSVVLYSQNGPAMNWQKVTMTGWDDRLTNIIQTSDGGYITLGQSNTAPGYTFDCPISKIDSNGNTVWSKTIGGSGNDYGKKIIKLPDGNLLVIGSTTSTDGDMTGHSSNEKMWVFKMDNQGNFIWKKFYNGEGLNDILPVADGYILAGNSMNSGFLDVRIHKITFDGTLVWTKTYGGSADDAAVRVETTPDNNLIVYAHTRSNNGNITGNHGQQDIWILRLDASGNLLSQRTYGGSGWEYAVDFLKDTDGYVFWGTTGSMDGDLTGTAIDSESDYWIAKMDFSGTIVWQKKVGSNNYEYYDWGKIIKSADNSYITLGLVWGGFKTVSGSNFHGASDIWMVKYDTSGNIIWKRCWGGSTYDYAMNFIQDAAGSLVVVGGTNSQNGDLAGSGKTTGGEDPWIFKLFPENFLSMEELEQHDDTLKIYPNPVSDFIYVDTSDKIRRIEIFSADGRLVKSSEERKIDVSKFAAGMYILKVQTAEKVRAYKIMKK